MKVPEFMFVIINPVMRFILKSPLHVIFSSGIMLITFTGRKSGRQFTTPVRYLQDGDTVRCFTARENKWWRNLRQPATVTLRIRGRDADYEAVAIHEDPEQVRPHLMDYLTAFPEDAGYHNIRVRKGQMDPDDLERAIPEAIAVKAQLLT